MTYSFANVAGRAALVSNGAIFDINRISNGTLSSDPMNLIDKGDDLSRLQDRLGEHTADGRLDGSALDAPVPRPGKIFGIGLNYSDHAAEGGLEVPDNPLVFAKFPNCITGPFANIELRSDRCDYEGEVVVVIGRRAKDVPVDTAWDYIFGITAGQDISDRAVQMASKPPHFDLGKSFDTFGPIGPVVVSPDSLDNRDAISVRTVVNDEVRQESNTDKLIFSIPTLVHYLSRITTLDPGDLIFTGTPAGVGMPQKKWLANGDVITTEVGGVARTVNKCVRVSDHELPVRRKSA